MWLFDEHHHTYNSLVLIFTIFWLNWWACFINPRDSKVSGSSLSLRMASGTKNCRKHNKKALVKCIKELPRRTVLPGLWLSPDRLQPAVWNCHVCVFLRVPQSHYLSKAESTENLQTTDSASASSVASITVVLGKLKKGADKIQKTYRVCWTHLLRLTACPLEVPGSKAEVWLSSTGGGKSSTVDTDRTQLQAQRQGRMFSYHGVSQNPGGQVQLQVPQDDLPTQLVQGRLDVCQGKQAQPYDQHTSSTSFSLTTSSSSWHLTQQ